LSLPTHHHIPSSPPTHHQQQQCNTIKTILQPKAEVLELYTTLSTVFEFFHAFRISNAPSMVLFVSISSGSFSSKSIGVVVWG
jgi:hypothetical protein